MTSMQVTKDLGGIQALRASKEISELMELLGEKVRGVLQALREIKAMIRKKVKKEIRE
jgi:transcription initiation factor IIE alpha subunit